MTDHTQEAHRHINWTHEWQEMDGDTPEANIANAHLAVAFATLALAEQQRIANIIALGTLQIHSNDGSGALVGDGAQFRALYPRGPGTPLAPEIATALGITEKS